MIVSAWRMPSAGLPDPPRSIQFWNAIDATEPIATTAIAGRRSRSGSTSMRAATWAMGSRLPKALGTPASGTESSYTLGTFFSLPKHPD